MGETVFNLGWDFGALFFAIGALALIILAFDVWMLVDAIQRPPEQFSSRDAKTLWIVGLAVGLVTGLPAIAVAIAYYVVVKRPAGDRVVATAAVPSSRAPGGAPPPGSPPVPPQQAPPTNCRNCGAKLVAGARFCHSCGAAAV